MDGAANRREFGWDERNVVGGLRGGREGGREGDLVSI